jgi:hypothetical protein
MQYMEALVACHKEHSISKWWGACNDAKFALTKCLAEEKKQLRWGQLAAMPAALLRSVSWQHVA